jgi:hypothetical protein
MALYTAGVQTAGVNTATLSYFTLQAGATRPLRIYRVVIGMPTACSTVPQLQLRRVTTAGVTPGVSTTPQALLPTDPAAAATLTSGGYGTAPVVAATALDVATLPLTAGAGWVWNFATPILVTNGTANGLAIYNVVASGATLGLFTASFFYDE